MGAYDYVPQPHRPADLIMGGVQSLGQGAIKYGEDNAPGDSALDAYINRVLSGEHPEKLAAEAKANPAVAAELQRLLQQGGQQGDLRHLQNDVGMPGGQPAVQAPGTQPHAPFAQPQSLGAMGPAHGPTMGGHGGPSASPAPQPMYQSGAAQPAPQAPAQQGPNMISAAGQLPPQLPSLGGYGQVAQQAMQADGGMGQGPRAPLQPQPQMPSGPPMQTAQLPPPQMQTAVSPRPMAMPAPQPRPQPAPQPAQRPAPQAAAPAGPPVRKLHQQMQILNSPAFAGAAAGQSREWVANQNNQTKETIALSRDELNGQIAALKSMGLSDKQISEGMKLVMTQNAENQRATLKAFVSMANEQTRAGATLGAAKTRASVGENPDEKELRNLETQIAKLESKTKWEAQPTLRAQHAEFERQIGALARKLKKPYADGGQGGPASTSDGNQEPTLEVRNRQTGEEGTISASEYSSHRGLYEVISN